MFNKSDQSYRISIPWTILLKYAYKTAIVMYIFYSQEKAFLHGSKSQASHLATKTLIYMGSIDMYRPGGVYTEPVVLILIRYHATPHFRTWSHADRERCYAKVFRRNTTCAWCLADQLIIAQCKSWSLALQKSYQASLSLLIYIVTSERILISGFLPEHGNC